MDDDIKRVMDIVFPDLQQRIEMAAVSDDPLVLSREEVKKIAVLFEEHAILKAKIRAALKAYQSPGKRHDARASDALKILGFSTGKRKARAGSLQVFHDYLNMVIGGIDWNTLQAIPPVSKQEAIKAIQKKYQIQDYEAAYTYIKRAIQDQGHSGQGLLPPNWDNT
jgi:hypothetical protein